MTPPFSTPLPNAPSIRAEEFANLWNRLRGSLPRVDKFTEDRRKKVSARIKAGLTLERFQEAIENCHVKPFLLGDNDRGWTADFDWLIANSTNTEKAINNSYGLNRNGGNGHVNRNRKKATVEDHNIAVLREHSPQLFTDPGPDSAVRVAPANRQGTADQPVLAGRMGGAVEPF